MCVVLMITPSKLYSGRFLANMVADFRPIWRPIFDQYGGRFSANIVAGFFIIKHTQILIKLHQVFFNSLIKVCQVFNSVSLIKQSSVSWGLIKDLRKTGVH